VDPISTTQKRHILGYNLKKTKGIQNAEPFPPYDEYVVILEIKIGLSLWRGVACME